MPSSRTSTAWISCPAAPSLVGRLHQHQRPGPRAVQSQPHHAGGGAEERSRLRTCGAPRLAAVPRAAFNPEVAEERQVEGLWIFGAGGISGRS